ncbi:MAG: NADP(H)-dependent aldo-keto reductase [Porticoccaceae bacterium]
MEYRKLGGTDIGVSAICLGTMTWGEQNSLDDALAQMDYAVSAGVNFFDAAEMYPVPPRAETQGRTEAYIGEWFALRQRRSDVILATKVSGRSDAQGDWRHLRGGPRLSREHIRMAVRDSLQRLQTDYIDLYQVHWPERVTNFFGQLGYRHRADASQVPIEETLGALDELVGEGLVRHIGISNETPWGMMEYLRAAREKGLARIVSIQNPFNLLNRSFEVGLAEMAIREQVGLLAYSPLAMGTLAGKYVGGARPANARLTLFKRFQRYSGADAVAATEAYVALARRLDMDPATMALAYVNSRDFVTSNIVGATSVDQLRANIASIDQRLPVEAIEGIEAIHKRYSNPAP